MQASQRLHRSKLIKILLYYNYNYNNYYYNNYDDACTVNV